MSGLLECRRTRVLRTVLPENRRVLMLSDIHGHHRALESVLSAAGYTGADALVIVGDLIEKGAASLPVICTLMELSQREHVYVLMGNMDVFTVSKLMTDDPGRRHRLFEYAPRMVNWWGGCLLWEMCDELGLSDRERTDEERVIPWIRERFQKELSFLSGLNTVLDTPRMTFVHGGLPHLELDSLKDRDSDPLLKCDDFLGRGLVFPKYVTVGHWPVVLYRNGRMDMSPMLHRGQNVLCLDGGCGVKKSGQLNCVIWQSPAGNDFSFVWADELPRVTALSDQSPSRDDTYIKYHDRKVALVRDGGGDFVTVRWHMREVEVPRFTLDTETPGQLNTDITDRRLPVRAGDELSLVRTVGGIHYVRRDGELGWYEGKTAPCGRPAPARPKRITDENGKEVTTS